jgi:hypothetical protein
LYQKLIDTKSIHQYPKNQNYQYPEKQSSKKTLSSIIEKPKEKSNISQLLISKSLETNQNQSLKSQASVSDEKGKQKILNAL